MARTYGKVKGKWVQVSTDANGMNSMIMVTTLIQNLKGILGESPFWAAYGLPSIQAVISQIYPDYNIQMIQQQFMQYFSYLIISRNPIGRQEADGSVSPIYNVAITLLDGTELPIQQVAK